MKRGKRSGAARIMAASLAGLFVVALLAPIAIAPSCEGGEAARAIEQLRDEACACDSRACAHDSVDRFIAHLADHAETEFSPATLERTKDAAIELIECSQAVGISVDKRDELIRAIQAIGS